MAKYIITIQMKKDCTLHPAEQNHLKDYLDREYGTWANKITVKEIPKRKKDG